jgi:hypothetical protein
MFLFYFVGAPQVLARAVPASSQPLDQASLGGGERGDWEVDFSPEGEVRVVEANSIMLRPPTI